MVPHLGMKAKEGSCPHLRLPFEVENYGVFIFYLFDTGSYVAQAGTGCSRGWPDGADDYSHLLGRGCIIFNFHV